MFESAYPPTPPEQANNVVPPTTWSPTLSPSLWLIQLSSLRRMNAYAAAVTIAGSLSKVGALIAIAALPFRGSLKSVRPYPIVSGVSRGDNEICCTHVAWRSCSSIRRSREHPWNRLLYANVSGKSPKIVVRWCTYVDTSHCRHVHHRRACPWLVVLEGCCQYASPKRRLVRCTYEWYRWYERMMRLHGKASVPSRCSLSKPLGAPAPT